MRFDCNKRGEIVATGWRRWFAWYPVKVGEHDCRWLEWVERASTTFPDDLGFGPRTLHEYRAIDTQGGSHERN
jgi:hypothetical protein